MVSLVGYTGFVGSNIAANGTFDGLYNTKNIEQAFATNPELLIYSGVRAEKFLANNDPDADMDNIHTAFENIERIAPKKLVLISTVDVFKSPNGKDETCVPETDGLHAYGSNRLKLENMVREKYPDALIVRLPGLFGINLKKNFLFDMIQIYPSMLNEEKFNTYCSNEIKKLYKKQDNGFYKCTAETQNKKRLLKEYFTGIEFNALKFTDSRSVYQFYPLEMLYTHIQTALTNGLTTIHMAVEPVGASEVFEYVRGVKFENEFMDIPAYYDFKTKYAELFGGCDGYILRKDTVLKMIKDYINGVEDK